MGTGSRIWLHAVLWILFVMALGVPRPAEADLLSLSAELHTGGAGGSGVFGERQDDAFQEGARGMIYGGKVGVEVLFVDVWIGHDQYVGSGGLIGTWTQFMTGLDLEMPLGQKKSGYYDKKGRQHGGYHEWYGEFGFGLGFGVGTGQQIDPPLDNSEVTDKGFLFEGRVGAGYRLLEYVSLGFTVPVTAGYFVKSGPGAFINDADNRYVSMSAAAMVNLRFKYGLK